jgi:hypothetical protein
VIINYLLNQGAGRLRRIATLLAVLGALLAVGATPATAAGAPHPRSAALAAPSSPAPVISASSSPKPAPRPPVKTGNVPKPKSSTHTVQPATAWMLTFTASPTAVLVGNYTTLTAVANQDVQPTPYFIQIYDDTGKRLVYCGSGTTCSVTVAYSTPTSRTYLAVVSDYATTWPNIYDTTINDTQAAQYQDVNWFNPGVRLTANYTTVPVGAAVTLDARTSFDVGFTPYWIEIFDNNTGTRIAVCGGGTDCYASVTYSQLAAHRYVAYISANSTQYPPTGIQAASVDSEPWVTWTTSNLRVSLRPSTGDPSAPYSATATANADVGPTPYYIEIFSETRNPTTGIDTGSSLLTYCGSGTACTVNNIPAGTPVTAFISRYATVMPPDTIANSGTVTGALIP